MNHRSDYDFHMVENVIVVIDKNIGNRSVTNDAEEVIKDLARDEHNLDALRVIYRDSQGDWCLMQTWHRRFAGFVPIQAKDEAEAVALAQQMF